MTSHERLKDIERIVNRSSAAPNDEALRQIRQHVAHLRSVVSGNYPSGKLHEIEEWSEIYFSQRKHKKYTGGAEQVAVWILAACGAVETSLPAGA
jgi:hypothetical protein